jgi:rsbT co-antagonist protein RsbR
MSIAKERIEQVVDVLAKAACKEYQHRVPISGDVQEDAFLHIEVGMNVVLEDLEKAEAARVEYIAEIERKNREIADRAAMGLRELSTPIISVWDGVLTLPVIGMVDTVRGAEMMEQLLARVASDQAEYVVIDITGVSVVDTRTADSFIRMSEAVRLVGAQCFLTGISPAIAQTIAQLGIDTSRIRTLRRLSDALKVVFEDLGIHQGHRRGAVQP